MKNVIVLLIDSLRFDYINREIGGECISPNIKKLFDNGFVANNYFSNGSPTMMALPSIHSSTLPLDYSGYARGMNNRPTYIHDVFKKNHYETMGLTVEMKDYYFSDNVQVGYDKMISVRTPEIQIAAMFQNMVKDIRKLNIKNVLNESRMKNFDAVVTQVPDEGKKDFIHYYQNCEKKRIYIMRCLVLYVVEALLNRVLRLLGKKRIFTLFQQLRKREKMNENIDRINKALYPLKVSDLFNFSSGNKLFSTMKKWIESSDRSKNFFLYAQIMDVHESNYCSYDTTDQSALQYEVAELRPIYKHLVQFDFDEDELKYLLSIKYLDNEVGKFVDFLDMMNLLDDTLLVFTADHGRRPPMKPKRDSEVFVATDFFDEYYHIPLAFYNRKQLRPYVYSMLCSGIDFAPTLIDIMGFSSEDTFQGISIFQNASDNTVMNKGYILMEHTGPGRCDPLNKVITISVRTMQMKVVYKDYLNKEYEGPNLYELFDLETDRDEQVNLSLEASAVKRAKILINIAENRMSELKKQYNQTCQH